MILPLRVTVAPERADAAPGDNLSFDVTVRNASDIVEHYGVEMLGLPDGATVRTEPDTAKLRPAETATVSVRVALPVHPPAPAGTYVVGVLVKSRFRDGVSRCVEVPVVLAAVEQITVRAAPEVVTGGRAGRYTIEVANGGNAPVRLYLAATDPERKVNTQFEPAWVDLAPGTSAQALLTVKASLPWNKEKRHQLSITADNPGLPGATATAAFVQHPRFASKFARVGGITAAVALLAAAISVPALVAVIGNSAAVRTPNASPTVAPAQTSAATPDPQPSISEPASSPASSPTRHADIAPVEREIDLTAPGDGELNHKEFSDQGFLISAKPDPGECAYVQSAAVVTDATGSFVTSWTEDPANCHTVPLFIDFLTPAGSLEITPVTEGTLTMEVTYVDESTSSTPTLKVSAKKAENRDGIDSILLRPTTTAPVAVTTIKFRPLG